MSESSSIKTCSSGGGDMDDCSSEVVIVEGWGKFRDNKKWKQRWCVLSKLSPAADCLQLQIYRDEKERARNGHTKASLSLEHFLALESGFTLDKESHTLAIICQDLSVVLAFDNRERLIQWSVRIANNLGEGQHFLVQLASAPTKSKLTPGPAKLHVTDRKFCLTGGIPPRLLGAWEVSHLRRYGVVEGRLVFEGGSRCGKGEGVHVLVPDQPQIPIIVDALDMSAKGQLARMPSRRFPGTTDSPRKSMNSRLSEMRNMSVLAESTTNVCGMTTSGGPLSRNLSPTPVTVSARESFSADELCSAAHDGPGQAAHTWMSSDSSSRGDLDSVDNFSVVNSEEAKGTSSPVKCHMSKPLPSAMERCLSCMSKLGTAGNNGDILSPSWTMDLNGVTPVVSMSTSISQSQAVGKGNSDRLSISSHGSSSNGAGGSSGMGEFYYDTPRSALMGRRANTPTNGSVTNSCCGSHAAGGAGSPQRMSITRCHCHSGQCAGQRNGPIYYNEQCEQAVKSHGAGAATKTPINLHTASTVAFENYDFPRCSSQHQQQQIAWNSGQCAMANSNIDWSKKHAMDRSSIASSNLTSDPQEFYDTPRSGQCCCPHEHPSRSCCSPVYQNQQPPPPPKSSHYHHQPQHHHAPAYDPMENYDIPPPFAQPLSSLKPTGSGTTMTLSTATMPTGTRVNGEGKMPLVAANSLNLSSSSAPIYAQVDKSKKTHRPQPVLVMSNCDNKAGPIYQNSAPNNPNVPAQPNYMNLEPVQQQQQQQNQPPASLPPKKSQKDPKANYVNMDFTGGKSGQLYENSQELKLEPVVVVVPKVDLVKPKVEAAYANFSQAQDEGKEVGKGKEDDDDEGAGLPLRRSSSVPCKGGHANRGSASSSDSGVSGDGGLYFEEPSLLGELGRLCLHESLPRKSSSGASGSKSGTPKQCESTDGANNVRENGTPAHVYSVPKEPAIQVEKASEDEEAPRHYETIDETKPSSTAAAATTNQTQVFHMERPKNHSLKLVSDANSTSSGASDMSDYIDTLSSYSRGSNDTVGSSSTNQHHNSSMHLQNNFSIHSSSSNNVNVANDISSSASPKRSASMKPRSGKEYFKIDRSLFNKE